MANDTNQVVICGRLTKDPEKNDLGTTGRSVTELRIAVNSTRKNGDNWEDVANFFSVSVFGNQADTVEKYLVKGSQVVVSGRLAWREYEKDGRKVERVSIIANQVQFVGAKNNAETSKNDFEDIPF